MESYESENYNIYIDYPSTWKALSNNSTLRFVSPYDDDNDTFRENLLISKNLNRNQSLTERIENLGQSIQDFRFIDHHNVTIDDNLSHGVTYSFTQNEKELKAMQIWTDRQDADYTITYFADVSKYKKFLPIIEKMINSLDISEFVTYNDNSVGLKIKYPAEWREVKIGMNKEISPKTILQYKSDLESLIVVYDSNPFVRNLTPRELGIQEINLLSQYHSDFNLLESEPTVVSGKPAHKIVYEINEGQNKFVETDIIAKSETGIFVISYVCLAEEYPERISTIRKISYSIKLNEFNDTSNNKTELKRPIFLTYENPSSGISIQYPKQWNIHEHFGVIMGYPVVSFTSEFESSLDRYKENITLYIEDKAYTEEYLRSHDSQLNITRNSNSLAGNEAQAFEYITKENGIDIRIVQIWTMVDEKIYRIRYVTEPVKYHDYKSILDKMISSFQINAPDSARWDYLTYENPALGLNIQYPVDWKLHFYNPNEILQKPVLVAKFGPYSENTSLAVIPTVDISISKLNINHITTEYLADLYIQHYMKLYPNFELLEVDNSTLLSGLPAYKFMSTATYPLDSTSQMINVVAIINKTVYNLRYYSEPEVFYTHLPKFDHMMQSFKIYN